MDFDKVRRPVIETISLKDKDGNIYHLDTKGPDDPHYEEIMAVVDNGLSLTIPGPLVMVTRTGEQLLGEDAE